MCWSNVPCGRFHILKDVGDKVVDVNDLLQGIQNGLNPVEIKTIQTVEKKLKDLKKEIIRVKNLSVRVYFCTRHACQRNLCSLVERVHWDLQLLNLTVAVDNKRLLQQVVDGLQRLEVAKDPKNQQERVHDSFQRLLKEASEEPKGASKKGDCSIPIHIAFAECLGPVPAGTPSAPWDSSGNVLFSSLHSLPN